MYLNRIKPKFVQEVEIKAEFIPKEPTVKYEEMTYQELLKEAKSKGLAIPRNAKKAELVEILEEEK